MVNSQFLILHAQFTKNIRPFFCNRVGKTSAVGIDTAATIVCFVFYVLNAIKGMFLFVIDYQANKIVIQQIKMHNSHNFLGAYRSILHPV